MAPLSVDYWDIEETSGSATSIQLRQGDLIEAKDGLVRSFQIRAFNKGAWAYGSTDDEKKVSSLLERTKENALALSRLTEKQYALGSFLPGKSGYRTPAKILPSGISIGEKLKSVREILKGAIGVKTNAGYSDSEVRIFLKTSEGLELEQTLVKCGLSLTCIATQSGRIERMLAIERASAGFEIVKGVADDFSSKCAERAKALLKAKAAPSGEMTVIIDPLLIGTFAHEAIGHMVEADTVSNNDSVLAGKLGETIGSPLATIVEDKTLPKGYGTREFDRDGAKAERTTVIEKGILQSYIHSRNSAGKMGEGLVSTGNCWGEFNQVRMSNTLMEPGDSNFEEIVKETKEGIYLLGSSGGTAMPSDGYFNFSALEGFLVRKGELAERVKDVAILGNALETLRAIDLVGKKVAVDAGMCGKGSEWVPVGSGGPHVRTKAIVGGAGK